MDSDCFYVKKVAGAQSVSVTKKRIEFWILYLFSIIISRNICSFIPPTNTLPTVFNLLFMVMLGRPRRREGSTHEVIVEPSGISGISCTLTSISSPSPFSLFTLSIWPATRSFPFRRDMMSVVSRFPVTKQFHRPIDEEDEEYSGKRMWIFCCCHLPPFGHVSNCRRAKLGSNKQRQRPTPIHALVHHPVYLTTPNRISYFVLLLFLVLFHPRVCEGVAVGRERSQETRFPPWPTGASCCLIIGLFPHKSTRCNWTVLLLSRDCVIPLGQQRRAKGRPSAAALT